MSDILRIRPAEDADGRRLYELDHRCWSTLSEVAARSAPPTAGSSLFDERHRPQDYLVAVLDGEVVGYIRLAHPTPLPSNAHILQVQGLCVDRSIRRGGVGRRLLEAAIARARHRGARRVTLRVLGHNAPARRLYESAGFAVEGRTPDEFYLDGRYVDDVIMGLTLIPAPVPVPAPGAQLP
jgi:ribosomal protein S18 acetylase RimI-like enzyme